VLGRARLGAGHLTYQLNLIISIPVAFKQLIKRIYIYLALATLFLNSYCNRFYVANANKVMFSFINSLK
jgi:hypothetical protein